MPVFNDAAYLREALESIASQTFQDFEVHVVDDASTDDTRAVAESFSAKDPRFHYRRNPCNLGQFQNQEECIRLAESEILILFQSDDRLLRDDYLEEVVDCFDDDRVTLVHGAWNVIDGAGTTTLRLQHRPENWAGPGVDALPLLLRSGVWPSACAFRRLPFAAIGGFRPGAGVGQDLLACFELALNGHVSYLSRPGVEARIHENSLTGRAGSSINQLAASAHRAFAASLATDDPIRAIAEDSARAWELVLTPTRFGERALQQLAELHAHVSATGKTLGVFGAGAFFAQLYRETHLGHTPIFALCDSDRSRWGTQHFAMVVQPPAALVACDIILVASQRFASSMTGDLLALGTPASRIVSLQF